MYLEFFGPHIPIFGMNTESYSVNLHIQSKCEKTRNRKTLNTDTFYAVLIMSFPKNVKNLLDVKYSSYKMFQL